MEAKTMAISLADPLSFADAVPYGEFARLRRESPVHWTPAPEGRKGNGFWSLTRHADIVAASRDTETFTSTLGIRYPIDPMPEFMRDNVILNDGARHAEIRSYVAAAFTRRMVSRFADWITEVVDDIIDSLRDRGACDLVPLVAVELPAQVICSVIGVPAEQRARVVGWTNAIFSPAAADGHFGGAQAAIVEAMEYALELRYGPHDPNDVSVLRELADMERDGAKISDGVYRQLIMSLLTAGFETTHTLIGQSLRLILEDPDIATQAYAAAESGDTAPLVEEFLRYVNPVLHMARHATRDVVLHETEIKAGDTVVLWHASANRDERVFERPDVFDLARPGKPHQGFGGGGPHFCLGNQLARLEVQILLREMLTKGPKLSLNGEPQRGWSNFINQLTSLPVVAR
jgi:cholest-4-en-3-one 26-monooxygenase